MRLRFRLMVNTRPSWGSPPSYNPPEKRAYPPGPPKVVKLIGEIVEARNQPIQGGRIFLSEFAASKVMDGREHTLCTYEWPGGGPYSTGLRLFISRLSFLLGRPEDK